MHRWLASVQPLASADEFARAQKLVTSFLAEDGPYLHQQLTQRDANDAAFSGGGHYPHSYIERFW